MPISAPVKAPTPANARPVAPPAQAPGPVVPDVRRTDVIETESCGPFGCDAWPQYGPLDGYAREAARRGHGHLIGEVGAYFLVPLLSSRVAFTTTSPGSNGEELFPQNVDFGPRLSLGYMCHTGW